MTLRQEGPFWALGLYRAWIVAASCSGALAPFGSDAASPIDAIWL